MTAPMLSPVLGLRPWTALRLLKMLLLAEGSAHSSLAGWEVGPTASLSSQAEGEVYRERNSTRKIIKRDFFFGYLLKILPNRAARKVWTAAPSFAAGRVRRR